MCLVSSYTPCSPTTVAVHDSNTIIKFADDTTVVGLINYGEEAYREFRDLAVWCQENNLSLNIS